jgi:5-hydroxyisourate hydrolase
MAALGSACAVDMAHLSTHVLDTSLGRPAAGLEIRLSILEEGNARHLKTAVTNADGRTDEPLLSDDRLTAGRYELIFGVGAYFRGIGVHLPDPPFLDEVIVRFGLSDGARNCHVPLLLSPYGYSTYRGS